MSFNSRRRKLLDDALPPEHRASHARSCALHVANALGLDRERVFALLAQASGVDLHHLESIPDLQKASAALEALRQGANANMQGQLDA